MLNIRFIIVMLACLTVCQAYGYDFVYQDFSKEYIYRSQRQTDINLQHSMMQDQVDALYNRQTQTQYPVPTRQNVVDDKIERPTYVIDKPLYKLNGD